jgi:hypothetical protein
MPIPASNLTLCMTHTKWWQYLKLSSLWTLWRPSSAFPSHRRRPLHYLLALDERYIPHDERAVRLCRPLSQLPGLL